MRGALTYATLALTHFCKCNVVDHVWVLWVYKLIYEQVDLFRSQLEGKHSATDLQVVHLIQALEPCHQQTNQRAVQVAALGQ